MIGAVTELQVINWWKSERSILRACVGPAAAKHSELLNYSTIARVKLTIDSRSLKHQKVNSVLGQYAAVCSRGAMSRVGRRTRVRARWKRDLEDMLGQACTVRYT